MLLFDLARRWQHIVELYTDDGLLPLDLLRAYPQAAYQFSLYTFVKTPAEAHAAFAATAVVYFSYLVGFQTRVAQALVLLVATSLDARNLLVENGGVVVINLLAAWTVFMPLGHRYSVDAWRKTGTVEKRAFCSIAVFGVLLQAVVIYALNVFHKNGNTWTSGDAIHYALWQNRVATPFAAWLRMHEPSWLSSLLTRTTLFSEAAIPILLMSPWRRSIARTTAFVLAVLLHGSIALVMRLGPFSPAMIGLVMLCLPGQICGGSIREATRSRDRFRRTALIPMTNAIDRGKENIDPDRLPQTLERVQVPRFLLCRHIGAEHDDGNVGDRCVL